MMNFLTTIYRTNFCSRPKRLLLELFDVEPDAIAGIVFEEIGLPYGGITTYRWWKTNRSGFFLKTHRSFRDAEAMYDTSKVVQDTAQRFDELLSLLEEADRPKLKHFLGNIRDGGVYSVAWGNPEQLRDLTIKNPKPDSEYSDLIQKLKENAWE